MAGITVSITGLPSITFNIFDFKLNKNAIREYCEKTFFTMNYSPSGQPHDITGSGDNPKDAPGTLKFNNGYSNYFMSNKFKYIYPNLIELFNNCKAKHYIF